MLDFSLINSFTNYEDLTAFILNSIDLAVSLSVIVATASLIVVGFKYILAMGDEEKTKKANKSLVFALVGLSIVFIAPLVVEYITEFLMVK